MTETKNQFFVSRPACKSGGGAKEQFLISWGCRAGSRPGLVCGSQALLHLKLFRSTLSITIVFLLFILPSHPSRAAGAMGDSLSGIDRRKYEALMLILEDPVQGTSTEARHRVWREFIAKSTDFLAAHPAQTNLWIRRAFLASELDYPAVGWLAGRKLMELGLENSDDPQVRRLFAQLERKDWLGATTPERDWSRWTEAQAKAAASAGDAEAQAALGKS